MIDRLSGFLKKPYDVQGDALNWFLFIGLIMVGIFIWHQIVRDLGYVQGALTGGD